MASWFGSLRNCLSGRNNRNDDGSLRLGDVVHPIGVIEVKRHKTVSMTEAIKTRNLARAYYKPWIHIEFKTGCAELVKLTVDHKTGEQICQMVDAMWRRETPPAGTSGGD